VVVNAKGRAYTQRVEPKLDLVQVELPPEAFTEDWQPTPDDHMGIVRWIHLYSLRAILLPVMELTVQPEWNQLIIDAKRESRFCSYFPLPFVHVPISVPLALHWEFMLIDQQLLAFMCWKRFLLCYMLPKNLSAHPLMDIASTASGCARFALWFPCFCFRGHSERQFLFPLLKILQLSEHPEWTR